MPLAFAPWSFWPVVILSPALLIFQIQSLKTGKQVFLLGWLYGLGYFGFGVSWIYNSLHVYGQAPVLVAGGLTGLMIVTLALFIGSALYLYFKLCQRYPSALIIWFLPPIWFAMEWLKGWVLTGFPWLSLGYAHVDSPLSGFAPLIGVYGISLLSILISVLLVFWQKEKKAVFPFIIIIIAGIGFILKQIDWTQPTVEPLTISMVQGNIPQEMKWRTKDRQKILDIYWNQTKANWSSDLVVWPEVAIPGRSEDLENEVLKPLTMLAKKNNSHVLTGIVVSNWLKREYYNSMILLGSNRGVYHKRHLVPFGEYYPFRTLLAFMKSYINIPMSDMSSGPKEQVPMKVKGVILGVSICYEDVFSRDINLDLPQAHILLNTSNDAWFGDSLAPHQHLQIARMRSLETGRPMVRSTNTGRSAYIDYKGKIVDATEQFKTQTVTRAVQGRQGSTPFLIFALIQPWLTVLILLSVIILFSRKPKIRR